MNIPYSVRLLLGVCFIVILGKLPAVGQSQNAKIMVRTSPKVERIFNTFLAQNQSRRTISGWRVQILATTDRRQLEQTRQRFVVNYPTLPVSYVHTKPYYKLRAGAFESKPEAERLKQMLDREFAGVYLVRDDIPVQEIIGTY